MLSKTIYVPNAKIITNDNQKWLSWPFLYYIANHIGDVSKPQNIMLLIMTKLTYLIVLEDFSSIALFSSESNPIIVWIFVLSIKYFSASNQCAKENVTSEIDAAKPST